MIFLVTARYWLKALPFFLGHNVGFFLSTPSPEQTFLCFRTHFLGGGGLEGELLAFLRPSVSWFFPPHEPRISHSHFFVDKNKIKCHRQRQHNAFHFRTVKHDGRDCGPPPNYQESALQLLQPNRDVKYRLGERECGYRIQRAIAVNSDTLSLNQAFNHTLRGANGTYPQHQLADNWLCLLYISCESGEGMWKEFSKWDKVKHAFSWRRGNPTRRVRKCSA